MTNPLDAVRAALETTPRERETLELDTQGWSDADKAAAAAELLDAARQGDWRVPAALGYVLSPSEKRQALEDLLQSAPPRVRVDAGWELRNRQRSDLQDALRDALMQGQLDTFGAKRAAELLLQSGAEGFINQIIDNTASEVTRTALLDELWQHRGLDQYPSVWWSGLGLLKRQLGLPMPSFRGPALQELRRLLTLGPRQAGYAPVAAAPPPPSLRAAMDDVERGSGPIPSAVLAPLTDEERQALVAFAADVALNRAKPRGIFYVGQLDGEKHRDLIDWAVAHGAQSYSDIGKQALDSLD